MRNVTSFSFFFYLIDCHNLKVTDNIYLIKPICTKGMNTLQEKQFMESARGRIINKVLVKMKEICLEDNDIKYQCQFCKFEAKSTSGLTIHINTKHETLAT